MKPRRPHQTGPPGLAHDSPRTPNVHISGPRRFKHHQNSTRKPPEREEKNEFCGGTGKNKARNFGPPTLRPPTVRTPHPSGAPLFLGWAPPPFGPPTLRAPTLRGPTFSGLGPPPFELRVVSVLISLTTERAPTGVFLVSPNVVGNCCSRACFSCCSMLQNFHWI